MKFQVAFALLAIFGAAQAGKGEEAETYGTGYDRKFDYGPSDLASELGTPSGMAEADAVIVSGSSEQADIATDDLSRRSEYFSHSASSFVEIAEEKKTMSNEYRKGANNMMASANEAYKNAQLHKRIAADKQEVAKEYEHRARTHDNLAKQQIITEEDDLRKGNAEWSEHVNNLRRANFAAASSNSYAEDARFLFDNANELETLSKDMFGKSEELEKLSEALKDKALKEKEKAKAEEAKAKEQEAIALNHENAFMESSKKVLSYKYYLAEFRMKGEQERHLAEDSRIRALYMKRLSIVTQAYSESLRRFAETEKKDQQFFKRRGIESSRQAEMLTKSAAVLMKRNAFIGADEITKREFPNAQYHGA